MILHNHELDDACYSVRLTASICGVDVQLRTADVVPSEGRFDRISPVGQLPMLEDGAVCLTELVAILRHLAAGAKIALIPENPASMEEWLVFAERNVPIVSQARVLSIFDEAGPDADTQRQAVHVITQMEDHMSRQRILGRRYFAGSEPSLADLALFPSFALSRDFGLSHNGLPALRRWARQIHALPGFITMPGIPEYH